MKKKESAKLTSGLSVKGHRYWSVMLVGEHGRVVPFRYFKEVVITVAGLIGLSLIAAIVLGALYVHQARQVGQLRASLDDLQVQAVQLKDERDVLRAKLVIRDLSTEVDAAQGEDRESATVPPAKSTPVLPPPAILSDQAQASPERQQAPTPSPVRWDLDIKQVEINYDRQREILKATFKVYNTSVPRKQISGRIVVAFKHQDDPSIKWLVVPNIPLRDGKPALYAGQAFSIQNYQTMDFKAFKPPSPESYNQMTVFVLMTDGELLLSRDFGIEIKTGLPLAPQIEPTSRLQSTEGPPQGGTVQVAVPAASTEPTGKQETDRPVQNVPTNAGEGQDTPPTKAPSPLSGSNDPKPNTQNSPAPSSVAPNAPNDPAKEMRSGSNQEGKTQ